MSTDLEIPAGAKLFQVAYKFRGETYATVTTAMTAEEAKAKFQREHQHLEVVSIN